MGTLLCVASKSAGFASEQHVWWLAWAKRELAEETILASVLASSCLYCKVVTHQVYDLFHP